MAVKDEFQKNTIGDQTVEGSFIGKPLTGSSPLSVDFEEYGEQKEDVLQKVLSNEDEELIKVV